MPQDSLPTKAALKAKYQIANDDFEILTATAVPTDEELVKQGNVLERVADWLGVSAYIVRRATALATVVAVLLVPARVMDLQDDISRSMGFYGDLVRPFRNLPTPAPEFPPGFFTHANVATTSSVVSWSVITPPPTT